MKVCNKCGVEKSFTEFFKRKNGYQGWCKECKYVQTQEWRAKNKEKLKADRASHYEKNREHELSISRKWKEENNEAVLDYAKNYAKEHKSERCALQMKRHARKVSTELLKGDEWNDFFIQEIYDLSRLRSEETGIKWHVDHEIPLQGERVTGLHVWNNLQLLPASLNCKKSNSFFV